jgi:hypothetical protein
MQFSALREDPLSSAFFSLPCSSHLNVLLYIEIDLDESKFFQLVISECNYNFGTQQTNIYVVISIGLNGKFLRFRRDGVNISYTVICLTHFDVCLAIA